jgi:succinate dehydrogenase/fumarate reductase flavoprotein subunit
MKGKGERGRKEKAEGRKGISRRDFLRGSAIAGAAMAASGLFPRPSASTQEVPFRWDRGADVVIIGAGAAGLPAAIEAVQRGASVIVVEANFDIGGHAIVSGGNIPLGGGTSAQKRYGIEDSPDLIFSDLTDWSVVQPNGFPDYRYNDKEIVRAFADRNVETFGWLIEQGVAFVDKAPDNHGATSVGNSAPREMHTAAGEYPLIQTGRPVDPTLAATTYSGVGLMRPLEARARRLGVQILLEHRMISIHRQSSSSGRVLGIAVDHKGRRLNIRAKKGIIIATGGSTSNVEFRRIFDPRLTEEYCGVAGEPWTAQDASGELAAMAIGASLWGTYNQTGEFGWNITKPGLIGCQYNYRHLQWMPGSPVFHLARASGLRVANWQDVILVNRAGKRFYDETAGHFTSNSYKSLDPYVPGSYVNPKRIKYDPANFINAALAGTGEARNGGGPIWAIFDREAVAREGWDPNPPWVDMEEGFFFSSGSIAGLARKVVMRYQPEGIPPRVLEETVNRYNSFVDSGIDQDFGQPCPLYKIEKPPFYAAWATPVIHDTRTGLRINAKCQVVDLYGHIIPGLYCAGESAGGFSQHGLARCLVQGRIAGQNAAQEEAME